MSHIGASDFVRNFSQPPRAPRLASSPVASSSPLRGSSVSLRLRVRAARLGGSAPPSKPSVRVADAERRDLQRRRRCEHARTATWQHAHHQGSTAPPPPCCQAARVATQLAGCARALRLRSQARSVPRFQLVSGSAHPVAPHPRDPHSPRSVTLARRSARSSNARLEPSKPRQAPENGRTDPLRATPSPSNGWQRPGNARTGCASEHLHPVSATVLDRFNQTLENGSSLHTQQRRGL